ncbi:MAG: AmmeMemoRadiSam system protein A, partial [Lachnospiraceae bacterium]|nr:AmmeMemoRadiSam system protein A [Lachnospiraceae bacterium]
AGALDSKKLDIKKYSHQDVTGVGYGICSFIVTGEDENRKFLDSYLNKRRKKLTDQRNKEDAFVRLARASLEHFIKEKHTYGVNEAMRAANISKEDEDLLLSDKAGAFVSIHKSDRLRGCIGTFLPTQYCLAEEIIANAVSASTRDPRFDPITEDELEWLEISVDVLGTPEDIDSKAELDPKKYGVIVRNGARRGLLLPDLPGVDTVEDQISIAKQKADIGKHEEVSLQRFTVIRHT